MSEVLLDVRDLHTHFAISGAVVRAVDGVSWDVRPGETVALVGESGCGKSVSALSVMRLVSRPAGRIVERADPLQGAGSPRAVRGRDAHRFAGRDIGMIFQEPMTSLNPVLTVGRQLTEPVEIHLGMTPAQSRARAIELLTLVGVSDAERRLRQYPHQFSGGMRQRMMIAMALSCNPALILADEPTTALDVTIQAQILELMKGLSRRLGAAMLMITHNLGVVARYADRVNVMYAGKIVERATARETLRQSAASLYARAAALGAAARRAAAGEARSDSRPAPGPEPAPGRLLVRARAVPTSSSDAARTCRRSISSAPSTCPRAGWRASSARQVPA